MTTQRRMLADHLEQVERDLVEVSEQLATGELDAATAERLRTTYRTELGALEERISRIDDDRPERPARDRRRAMIGAVLLLAGFVAVALVLMATVAQRRPGELATGGIVGDVAGGRVDLADVTNEEMERVVAENPGVVGMRMALAARYFEAGEFDDALPHYMTVLEQDPDNAEALANVGWMTHLSGRPDVGVAFVERAIAAAPDHAQAYWFLANIRFHGLDDPAGAVEPLERLLTYEGLPDEIRTQAEALLAEARG